MRSALALALVLLAVAATRVSVPRHAAVASPTPADGYTVHVLAPHLWKGQVIGPFHHYCKVIAADPIIQCQLYESTDSTAPLIGVEYIVAKTITRTKQISLADWNRLWHDHAQEIATGRVQVLDLPPDQAKQVADLVAKTDGIVFNLLPHGAKVPTGEVYTPQAVGHVNITAKEKFQYDSAGAAH